MVHVPPPPEGRAGVSKFCEPWQIQLSQLSLAQLQIHVTGCRNGVNWPHREWESFRPPRKCWTFKALSDRSHIFIYILQVGGSSGGLISSGYKRFKRLVEKAVANPLNMSDVRCCASAKSLRLKCLEWKGAPAGSVPCCLRTSSGACFSPVQSDGLCQNLDSEY